MAVPDPIYMPLVDEGTNVWAPVSADPFGPGFRCVRGPMPLGQLWAFPPGAVVSIGTRTFSGGEIGLVALEYFGAAPPECNELIKVQFSSDGLRRLCVFRRPDGLYQYREDSLSFEQDISSYWREGYMSGLHGTLAEAVSDAPSDFQSVR